MSNINLQCSTYHDENISLRKEVNTLSDQLIIEQDNLALKGRELTQKEEELELFRSQLIQAQQENILLGKQIIRHQTEYRNLNEDMVSAQREILSLHEQIEVKEHAESMRNQQIFQMQQEADAMRYQLQQGQQDIKVLQDELSGIYNSEGFKYILQPLWRVLWNIKRFIKFCRYQLTCASLTIFLLVLTPVFIFLLIAFLLESAAWWLMRWLFGLTVTSRPAVSSKEQRVSIVIPNFNGLQLLEKCLPSIFAASTFKDNAIDEVIIVDDASTDGSQDYIRIHYPQIKLIVNSKNKGFSYACNRGIKEAGNKLVALLNSDIIVTEDFLKPLIRHFADPAVFAVYPKIFGWDKSTFTHGMNMGDFWHGHIWLWNEVNLKYSRPVDYPSPSIYAIGGAMVFRKSDFLWLGGFDEIYNPYSWEDIDLSYRAWKRGLSVIYEPKGIVYHKGHGTIGEFRRDLEIKNEILFIWKNIVNFKYIIAHLNLLPQNIYRFGTVFLLGFLRAFNYMPITLMKRFLERRYWRLADQQILGRCNSHYRQFTRGGVNSSCGQKPKNVLYVSHFAGIMTGAETVLLNIIKYLDKSKYYPVVLCKREGLFTEALKRMSVEVFCFDFPVLTGAIDNHYHPECMRNIANQTVSAVERIARFITSREIDILHTNVSVVWAGALAARLQGVPHVWHSREIIPPGLWRELFSFFIPHLCSRIITVSRAAGSIFKNSQYRLIYDGVDTDFLSPVMPSDMMKREFHLSSDSIVIGFAGSIISWKGLHILFMATRKLVKKTPKVKILIAGDLTTDPHYTDAMLKLVNSLSLQNNVHFLGFRSDMPRFLSLVDIVVVPSRRPDPAPNIVMEAMAAGKTVVASGCGGILEIIQDRRTGFLFPAGDYEALSSILESLVSDPALRKTIGDAARVRVAENFIASAMSQNIQKVYEELLPSTAIATKYNKVPLSWRWLLRLMVGICNLYNLLKRASDKPNIPGWISDGQLMREYQSFYNASFTHDSSAKKNVLVVTPELPYPLNRGGNVKIFNHIKLLSEKYNMHLISFIHQDDERRHIPVLREFCKTVRVISFPEVPNQLAWPWHVPKTIRDCYSEEFKTNLLEVLQAEHIDLVQIDSLFMAFYVNFFNGIPAIFIEHDANIISLRRSYIWQIRNRGVLARFIELTKLSKFEADICKKFHTVITLSENDKNRLKKITGLSNINVVPAGVDTESFAFVNTAQCTQHNAIAFVGYMGHYPNEDGILYFCKHIFPMVQKQAPEVMLYIIGSHPTQKVLELGKDKHILVTGPVEDTRPYLQKCDVLVAPLRLGGGIRIKILEAMAAGIPVVATSTASSGIDAISGQHLILADKPRDFAQAVVELLRKPALRTVLCSNARNLVETRYNLFNTALQLEAVYQSVLNASR
ncbi:MAG: glycosyltransferase [Candidatus Omnitrophota bacterium]